MSAAVPRRAGPPEISSVQESGGSCPSLEAWAIALIVVAGVSALVLAATVAALVVRTRRRRAAARKVTCDLTCVYVCVSERLH